MTDEQKIYEPGRPPSYDAALFEALIEHFPMAVFLKDVRDRFKVTVWNQAAESIFEIPRGAILGKNANDIWPKDRADHFLASDEEALAKGTVVEIVEESSLTKSRGLVRLRTKKIPLRNGNDPEVRYVLCVCEDVTEERVKSEKNDSQIRSQERDKLERTEQLQRMLDGLPGMIAYWDSDLRNVASNKALAGFFGMTQEEIKGSTLLELLGREAYETVKPQVLAAVAGEFRDFELSSPMSDGSSSFFHHIYQPDIFEGKILGFFAIAIDITKQRRLEHQLNLERSKSLQNAKLASLGEMSAGIAHEINNPLAIISGLVRLLKKGATEGSEPARRLDEMQRALIRIEKIVNGLRKFSRSSDTAEYAPVLLNHIIGEALILTSAKALRHGTSVEWGTLSNRKIMCDEIRLEQVFVNLINNGIDAIGEHQAKWIRISVFEEVNAVVAQVRNSGPKIPLDVKKRLFEPFFTTKPAGQGTGLGLSIVKGILDEHKATIDELADDPNTCFEIRFPLKKEGTNVA